MMKILKTTAAIFLILFALPGLSLAAGTPAGTGISNSATVSYTVNSFNWSRTSLPVIITVDEKINLNLAWQDASNVPTAPGATDQVLTFLLTNTGNGSETFDLTANSTLGTADFNPVLQGIYFDTNGNGTYDTGIDIQHTAGTNDPLLLPDESITLFVVNDIPAAPANGDIGDSELTAISQTGSGPAGTFIVNGGDGGAIDALIGTSGGTSTIGGSYLVSTLDVLVNKSALVTDQSGGSDPMTGSTISYTLSVSVTGGGTATGLVITDPIPANTTYRSGTLRLNGNLLSDVSDGDAGDVGITTVDTVTVTLGDVAGGSAVQTITFDVTIN